MWCTHCQADVATEVAADGKSLLCASCSAEIRKVYAPSLHSETRSARELLERWSRSELLEPYQGQPTLSPTQDVPTLRSLPAIPEKSAAGAPVIAAAQTPIITPDQIHEAPMAAESPSPSEEPLLPNRHDVTDPPIRNARPANVRLGANLRLDKAHEPTVDGARLAAEDIATQPRLNVQTPFPEDQPRSNSPRSARNDSPQQQLDPPHFDIRRAEGSPRAGTRPGRQESIWGQVMAYLGVGLLTVGTVLVLRGYFGGDANLAPTGWLVCTAGQMLLFLGVVTLVSGGMQQTTDEVTRQVEHLDRRMIRIETSTHTLLKGPHFAAADQAARVSTREGRESA